MHTSRVENMHGEKGLQKMKVIGLTGNIGSGKSSVARILQNLGAGFIDADKVTHDIYNPGTEGWQAVVDAFGRDILDAKGDIDRNKLAQKVFSSPENHEKLNRILHPLIRKEVEARLEQLDRQGKEVTVLEAILLVEAGWMDMVNELWLVVAPKDLTLRRLEGRGVSESEALARLAKQPPPEKKMGYASQVINNEGNLEDLRKKVENLWQALHNERKG
jgi:dephospho-CoA kinase